MNLREHGVDFIDLEYFFEGELLTHEDERFGYAESRFQSIGMLADRVVYVVWTPADDDGTTVRLISARKATQRETQAWFYCYGTRH